MNNFLSKEITIDSYFYNPFLEKKMSAISAFEFSEKFKKNRKILNVYQIFTDNNYYVKFEKKYGIVAFFIILFDFVEDTDRLMLNDEEFKLTGNASADLSNFLASLKSENVLYFFHLSEKLSTSLTIFFCFPNFTFKYEKAV